MLRKDCSAVEAARFVTQWCPNTLHRESYAFDKTLGLAHPCLLQTKARVNFPLLMLPCLAIIRNVKLFLTSYKDWQKLSVFTPLTGVSPAWRSKYVGRYIDLKSH